MPKEQILGKSYQRNQIYLHEIKPKIFAGYSQDVTAGVKLTLQNITNKVVNFNINTEFSSESQKLTFQSWVDYDCLAVSETRTAVSETRTNSSLNLNRFRQIDNEQYNSHTDPCSLR